MQTQREKIKLVSKCMTSIMKEESNYWSNRWKHLHHIPASNWVQCVWPCVQNMQTFANMNFNWDSTKDNFGICFSFRIRQDRSKKIRKIGSKFVENKNLSHHILLWNGPTYEAAHQWIKRWLVWKFWRPYLSLQFLKTCLRIKYEETKW